MCAGCLLLFSPFVFPLAFSLGSLDLAVSQHSQSATTRYEAIPLPWGWEKWDGANEGRD